jgi:hypothetical protein
VSVAARILDRLDGVKPTGTGRWIAKCPAHPDRSPSLSIREADDGRVLLHDFGGCDTESVLIALGLTVGDLFAKPLGEFRPAQSAIPARDVLVLLDHEITVAVIILDEIVTRRKVNEGQLQRLMTASERIGKARDIACPAKVASRAA